MTYTKLFIIWFVLTVFDVAAYLLMDLPRDKFTRHSMLRAGGRAITLLIVALFL